MISRPRALLALGLALLACAHGPSPKQREQAEIQYQLGADALRGNRAHEALQAFDEALKIDPAHVPAHLGRGLALQLGGRADAAEAEYRKALQLAPAMPDAHNALAQLLAQTGRPEAALAEFDKALEDPEYPQAYLVHCNKATALDALGRRADAIAEVRACIALAPRYCRAQGQLGRLQLAAGDLKSALGAYKRQTELCPAVADAWYQLGLAQLKANDPDKARAAFERCAEITGEGAVQDCQIKAEALR